MAPMIKRCLEVSTSRFSTNIFCLFRFLWRSSVSRNLLDALSAASIASLAASSLFSSRVSRSAAALASKKESSGFTLGDGRNRSRE